MRLDVKPTCWDSSQFDLETYPRSYDFFRGTGDLGGSERLGLGEDGGCCEYEDGVGITLTLTFVGVEGAVKVLSEITGLHIKC